MTAGLGKRSGYVCIEYIPDHVQGKKALLHRCDTMAMVMASSLPAELLLEIVARSDAATFMRCAAACKSLRRDVLSPAFLRRVCRAPDGIFPARLLGNLDRAFSLVHPATPAAVSLASNHLAPSVSRVAAGLLEQYRPVTSRGGLVLLERRAIDDTQQPRAGRRRADELCVYNPTTGDSAFLLFPQDIIRDSCHNCSYVLLTAADGVVGPSFLLAAARRGHERPRASSLPVHQSSDRVIGCRRLLHYHKSGVVLGGIVHWLVYFGKYILTYDVMGTATAGMIKLSEDHHHLYACHCRLGSWPDGRLSFTTGKSIFAECPTC
ncbi:hypothetical protein ACP70R_019733 [Stipagrostis hirtigluma subsp. patula]